MPGEGDHTRIVSSTSRRTRIRVSSRRRNPHELAKIARTLNESPLINNVTANLRTGSVVIHHEEGVLDELYARLQDLGIIVLSGAGIEVPPVEGKTKVAHDLTEAVADLNRRLGLATSGFLNLRTLVPLSFGALAIVHLMRRGLEIEAAPWYVLAYAAFDSFVKLHYSREAMPMTVAARSSR